MQELNKEDTLANLYAIRAGLSIISEIADKEKAAKKYLTDKKEQISAWQKEIKDLSIAKKEEIGNCENAIRIHKWTISTYKPQLEQAQEDIILAQKEAEERRKKELSAAKTERRKTIIEDIIRTWWTILGALLGILVVVASVVINVRDSDSSWMVYFIIGWIILAGSIIVFLYYGDWKNWKISDTYRMRAIEEELSQKLNNANTKIKELSPMVRTSEYELMSCLSRKNYTLSEINERYANKIQQIKKLIAGELKFFPVEETKWQQAKESFSMIYGSMKEQFANVLDERDWMNVDLIIFNYETGRATDLRDALLQVDMERRNEKLVTALALATKEISHTIQRGFGDLTKVVEEKFKTLTLSIVYSAKAITDKLSVLEEQNDVKISQNQRIIAGLKDMVDISSAQAALMSKISVSSERLAEDSDYMREVVEYHDDRQFK